MSEQEYPLDIEHVEVEGEFLIIGGEKYALADIDYIKLKKKFNFWAKPEVLEVIVSAVDNEHEALFADVDSIDHNVGLAHKDSDFLKELNDFAKELKINILKP